jgi:hypothetical protein
VEDPHELRVADVCELLALEWQIADQPNCLKYVRKVSYTEYSNRVESRPSEFKLDWDDFNAIFCKGIFKYTLITATKNLL